MSLTLSRRNGEQLKLITKDNEIIEITVTNIRGNQVKINFDAPRSCRIIRKELIEDVSISR